MERDMDEESLLIPNLAPIRSKSFVHIYSAAQFFGILSVTLVSIWVTEFLGGFEWSNPQLKFNFHPFFMITGFIFFYGNGILIYKILYPIEKFKLKLVHAILNLGALVFAITGLLAVWTHIPFSIHSWMGLTTLTLFGLQWIMGFITFLVPNTPEKYRKLVKPYHVFAGLVVFGLAATTALLGIMQEAALRLDDTYVNLPAEALVLNFMAFSIVCFTISVIYLVTKSDFKIQK